MDRSFVCGAEGLEFDPYWTQVSIGGFLDCAHLSLLLPGEKGYNLSAYFRKKKTPNYDSALCGILGVSFTYIFYLPIFVDKFFFIYHNVK